MRSVKTVHALTVANCFVAILTSACGGWWSSSSPLVASPVSPPVAATLAASANASESTIRFLEDRVKRDPDDFSAHNKLASIYLQRQRETGNVEYVNLAFNAARASLAMIPAELNSGGLAALTQAEFASHEFHASRDHALKLTQIEPGKSYPYQMLGDALLELGEYGKAAAAYRRMEELGGGVTTETRLARLATLRGQTSTARRHLKNALALALDSPAPSGETVAWCRWQLGETAFAVGDYETAEIYYRDALTTFPDYPNALASLGRARAAQGDLREAIDAYEKVVRRLPDPLFIAALGDIYKLAGQEKEAAAQYALVEQIARLNEANGALYNRQIALFYADHDLKAEDAYANATKEYAGRRDIYGADAVAWTALKADKLAEAQTAMREALRLGTKDARLLYHAGLIARAAGDESTARNYLRRALALNPQFDPLQAALARKALED